MCSEVCIYFDNGLEKRFIIKDQICGLTYFIDGIYHIQDIDYIDNIKVWFHDHINNGRKDTLHKIGHSNVIVDFSKVVMVEMIED